MAPHAVEAAVGWLNRRSQQRRGRRKYLAAMARLHQAPLQDAVMSYCNSGYALLGRLVEVLGGQAWDRCCARACSTHLAW
jgi:CubicO group peptidase (beta-lactamase class C family)